MVMQSDATGSTYTGSLTRPKSEGTKSLSDFLMPAAIGLGTGLRTSAHIMSGLGAKSFGSFNEEQVDYELGQLAVSEKLSDAQFKRYARQLEGEQATVIATSGLATSGSIVDLMIDTSTQLELQRIDSARQYEQRKRALETEKSIGKYQAEQQEKGAFISAGATALSGVSDLLEFF